MKKEMDWSEAENHLKLCEEAYAETGSAGRFAMTFVIAPCRDRFNKGERTRELYDEIFDISL
jgi:hypothetical protein